MTPATRSQHSYILRDYAVVSGKQGWHMCTVNALAGMYFLSVAQSLNLAVKLFQLSEGQKFIQLILIPINIQANYFIELQSVNTLLRLLLLCRRTHLSVKSGIRDLEAGNTIDADVEDRYKDERD